MKRIYLLSLLTILTVSCTNSGAFLATNQTNVELGEGNYTLTATGISGEAESAYILGLSYSSGFVANTIAIARVSGSEKLYSEALDNLWLNYEKNHGAISDKKLALTNVRYDADILNLLVYSKVKITVRADIIELN